MTIYRGDTWSQTVLFDDFTLTVGDKVKIGVKRTIGIPDYTLFQEIGITETASEITFTFSADEMAKITPGRYWFEIEITKNAEVSTVYQEQIELMGDVIDG